MAKHEFGIMINAPKHGKRYDKYEPWKYNCISVDDACLNSVIKKLTAIAYAFCQRQGACILRNCPYSARFA